MRKRLNFKALTPFNNKEYINAEVKEIKRKTGCILNILNIIIKEKNIKFVIGWNLSKLFIKGGVEYNITDKPVKVAYITGADIMIRKEVFLSEKGFDPDFFMYFDPLY